MVTLLPVTLLSLASIVASEYLKKSGAVTYLILLMASLDILYLAATVDVLRPAAILLYLLFIAMVLIYAVRKGKVKTVETFKKNCDIYMVLNWISSALFAIVFTIQNPRLYYWDEISFWGPSAKYMKLTHHIHSIGINPCLRRKSYPAGHAVLNYFFSFFTRDFAERLLLLSFALLYFAVFSMIARVIYEKTQNHTLGISSYFVLFLSPFMATVHNPLPDYSSLSYAYGTVMPDFTVAVVFAAVIGLYLADRRSAWFLLPLAFLLKVKNSGILFVVLAICVITCIAFFSCSHIHKRIKQLFIVLLIVCLIPLVLCGVWGLPQEPAIPENETVAESSAEQASPSFIEAYKSEHPYSKLCVVFLQLGTKRFHEVLNEMPAFFLYNHETIFGRDIVLIAGLFLLGLLAAFGFEKKDRLSILGVNLGFTAGSFMYSRIIAYEVQFFTNGMIEYPRYMQSYYFAWMFVIFMLILVAPHTQKRLKQILLCSILLVTIGSISAMGLDYTILSAPQNAYATAAETEQYLKPAKDILQPEDRVYLIFKDQDTASYNTYQYYFLPNNAGIDTKGTDIDFSICFREQLDPNSDRQYYNVASPEEFTSLMQEYFDYIYVIEPDPEVKASYGALFSDGMSNGHMYKITDEAIPMQEVTQ